MQRYVSLFALILLLAVAGLNHVAAEEDLPMTFSGCVIAGGQIRVVDDETTCRRIRSYDFRIYGTTTTTCGEEIDIEIWGETRRGVVTFPLEPARTTELPEVGGELPSLSSGTPIPCRR